MQTVQDQGALKVILCGDCGSKSPAGVPCCSHCGSENLKESLSSGRGTIYTYTVMDFVPVGRHKDRAPYVLAVVETEEGMRLSAIVESAHPHEVRIGKQVVYKEYLAGAGFVFREV